MFIRVQTKTSRQEDNTTVPVLEIKNQLKIQYNKFCFKIIFPIYESLCGFGPKGLQLTSKVD